MVAYNVIEALMLATDGFTSPEFQMPAETPVTKDACATIEKTLDELLAMAKVESPTSHRVWCELAVAEGSYENVGFLNGFKVGVSLALELFKMLHDPNFPANTGY